MRKIAIIGAGQAGLLLGIGLVDAGYTVTLFSDRTPEAILHGFPMAFPVLFDRAREIERQLGLNFWDEQFPGCQKIRNSLCDPNGNPPLTLFFNLEQPWQGIDQRLKFCCWMQEFVARGGELVIQAMTLSHLEECTQNYDLVVVAAGRGILSTLFERDAKRSTRDKPARRLAGGFFTGLKGDDLLTFKLTVLPGIGETFQVPFYDKDKGYSYAVVFEAYPAGAMDRFASVQSGQRKAGEQVSSCAGEPHPMLKSRGLDIDVLCLTTSSFSTNSSQLSINKFRGLRPHAGGGLVLLTCPPAFLVTQRIIEHGNRNFDARWMQAVFDEFWIDAQHVNSFCDCLLMPQAHHQEILVAAAHNRDVARDYFNGAIHPPRLFPWFFVPEAAKNYLAQKNVLYSRVEETAISPQVFQSQGFRKPQAGVSRSRNP